MSLILDALRKSERERLGQAVATESRTVGMDELGDDEQRAPGGRRWPVIVGLCTALVIVGGAAGYKFWFKPRNSPVAIALPPAATSETMETVGAEMDPPPVEEAVEVAVEPPPPPSLQESPTEEVVVMAAAEQPVEPAPETAMPPAPDPEPASESEPEPVPDPLSDALPEREQHEPTELMLAEVPPPVNAVEGTPVEAAPDEEPTITVQGTEPEAGPETRTEASETGEPETVTDTPAVEADAVTEPESAVAEPDRFPTPAAKPETPPRPVVRTDDPGPSDPRAFYDRAVAFESEGLYAQAIAAYTDAILLNPEFAEAYYGRAWAHVANGAYTEAISDFSRLLAIKPGMPEAHFGRGWAHELAGEADAAIRDYGDAIRVAPRLAALRFNRGILKLYEQDFVGAERDFMAVQDFGNATERDFATIWTFIARAKAGAPLPDVLPALRDVPANSTWPGIIVDYYFGRVTESDVVAATETGDFREEAVRACTAFYFLGQHALISGNEADAANYFRRAASTDATTLRQYWAAILELDRLGIVY